MPAKKPTTKFGPPGQPSPPSTPRKSRAKPKPSKPVTKAESSTPPLVAESVTPRAATGDQPSPSEIMTKAAGQVLTRQPEPTPEPSPEPTLVTEKIFSKAFTDDEAFVGSFETVDFGGYSFEGESGSPDAVIIDSQTGIASINATTAFMSVEQFHENFKGMFDIAGSVTGNPGFPIQSHEEKGARATSQVLYEQCEKVTWMHWLIAEEGSAAAKYLSVAMFGLGKYKAVQAGYRHMAAERAAAAEAAKDAETGDKADA